ncbi:siphovirus Gp157 family protein [Brucella sp. 6810]|uniref:siphovirus Gp157 family protein n=1 Tax=Brucella sp. 6810 TaxID=2769351 RepID=UPI00165C4EE2|nr:siphovirus Gp157 family protein [Brucella sp. 6810]QNQ62486.1 siphovirus Gp157 family protein [Brucella sp. 6810]
MSGRYLKADLASIEAQISELVSDNPELADDEELRVDMIDGETSAIEFLHRVYRRMRKAEALAEGAKSEKDDAAERQKRFEKQADGYKALSLAILNAADVEKLVTPFATYSVLSPRTKAEVTDLDAIPQGFYRIEKKPDLKAIKSALEAGEKIPGAELSLGVHSLMIRRA